MTQEKRQLQNSCFLWLCCCSGVPAPAEVLVFVWITMQ